MADKLAFLHKVTTLLDDHGMFILITPTYEHTKDAAPISVSKTQTLDKLHALFTHVDEHDLGWATCFICRQNTARCRAMEVPGY